MDHFLPFYFEIMEIEGKDILFRTGVEAGTYIRKLFHDIGKEIWDLQLKKTKSTLKTIAQQTRGA